MVEPGRPRLSIARQCELVSISRSGFCRRPAGETPLELGVARQIEAQILKPLRVASALLAPTQPQRAGLAERAHLEPPARLHGPTGRPLLLLKVGEVFPALP